MSISGLDSTALGLTVYASQGGSPLHHARLVSGCWPSSAGRDSLTRRVAIKGFCVRVTSSFLELFLTVEPNEFDQAVLTANSERLEIGRAHV